MGNIKYVMNIQNNSQRSQSQGKPVCDLQIWKNKEIHMSEKSPCECI